MYEWTLMMSGIKKEEFASQPSIVDSLKRAKEHGSRIHFCGLISDGGVHSHITHLFSLLKAAKAHGIEHVYIHFFGDGRDTAPKSATKYLAQLQDFVKEQGVGEVSTVVGRYYAMDRDKRWDRVKIAVDGLVQGKGDKVEGDLISTIEKGYENNITDEFIKPIICGSEDSRIKSGSSSVQQLTVADLIQRMTPSSCSTTDRTVCGRLSLSWECPTSQWRSRFPKDCTSPP